MVHQKTQREDGWREEEPDQGRGSGEREPLAPERAGTQPTTIGSSGSRYGKVPEGTLDTQEEDEGSQPVTATQLCNFYHQATCSTPLTGFIQKNLTQKKADRL